jgi:nucleoside phosphorylase
MTELAQQPPTVDFVIITVLEEERDAVLNKLPEYQQLTPSDMDIRIYYSSVLPISFPNGSTSTYHVIVMPLLGMGRMQATIATADAIRRWQPRYVILVGIAGGVAAKEVKLGDILVSDQIVDYELQKLTPQGPQVRWEVHRADPRLLGAACNFSGGSWQALITTSRPGKGTPARHIGPIASGDKVIAFDKILAHYREKWPALIGVEMEAAGVATASFQAAQQPGFFMVRGVSDLADEKKGLAFVKRWRSYACDVAASYAIALLKSGPVKSLLFDEVLFTKNSSSIKPEEKLIQKSNISGDKPWIFLCHASEDKSQVAELYHKLKEAGYQPWLDKEDLLPGQDWRTEIRKIITDTYNLVVVCLSNKSVSKRGIVQEEIKWALDVLDQTPEGTIYLIPARLEPCQVPDRLSSLHWVNLFEPNGFEKLRQALDHEINKRQASSKLDVGKLRPVLWFYEGEKLVRQIGLEDFNWTEPVYLGTASDCQIQIKREYRQVSRRHAQLLKVGDDTYFLKDNQSKFGTHVNGVEINHQIGKTLVNGDRVVLGSLSSHDAYTPIQYACLFIFRAESGQKASD